jgi:ABC-2 type transport system permease protein
MIALIRSEFRKVLSTKLLLILSLSALAFMLLQIFLSVLLTPPGFEGTNRLMEPAYIKTVIASAGSASVFLLILGIVAMSGEYRNQTITSTFLATPIRWRVMVAKMATFAILAFALALVLWFIAAITTMLLLGTQDSAPFEWSAAFEILAGTLIGLVLYAILGVAIGSLITSQVAAVVIALVFSFVVEPLITVFFLSVGKWMPGNALNAILQTGGGGPESNASDLLGVVAGVAVLVGYTLVFAIAAALTTNKRDIT